MESLWPSSRREKHEVAYEVSGFALTSCAGGAERNLNAERRAPDASRENSARSQGEGKLQSGEAMQRITEGGENQKNCTDLNPGLVGDRLHPSNGVGDPPKRCAVPGQSALCLECGMDVTTLVLLHCSRREVAQRGVVLLEGDKSPESSRRYSRLVAGRANAWTRRVGYVEPCANDESRRESWLM